MRTAPPADATPLATTEDRRALRSDLRVDAATAEADDLVVRFTDGRLARYPLLWLRDACACARCRHPHTNQRLTTVSALPVRAHAERVERDEDGAVVEVSWAEGGHRSRYAASWLGSYPWAPRPWSAADAPETFWVGDLAVPRVAWGADGPAWRRAVLTPLLALGFVVVEGAPLRAGLVTEAAERFGFVRETNYGRTFDVVTVPNPEHLAYADVPLALHTDNPYRDPVPGIQLLHCREASTDGGDTTLLDGFRLAHDLRASDAAAFAALAATPVPFRYRDATCDIRSRRPILALADAAGTVRAVHVNDRSMQPLDAAPDAVGAWYRAYRVLDAMLAEPARIVRFRLRPGDVLFFDNERVLHGRTGLTGAGGRRHLEGCYADRDAFESALRIAAADASCPA